jgi:hypothetical protein
MEISIIPILLSPQEKENFHDRAHLCCSEMPSIDICFPKSPMAFPAESSNSHCAENLILLDSYYQEI